MFHNCALEIVTSKEKKYVFYVQYISGLIGFEGSVVRLVDTLPDRYEDLYSKKPTLYIDKARRYIRFIYPYDSVWVQEIPHSFKMVEMEVFHLLSVALQTKFKSKVESVNKAKQS